MKKFTRFYNQRQWHIFSFVLSLVVILMLVAITSEDVYAFLKYRYQYSQSNYKGLSSEDFVNIASNDLAKVSRQADSQIVAYKAAAEAPADVNGSGSTLFSPGKNTTASTTIKLNDIYTGPTEVSKCSNCWLYPVGKTSALSSSYVPKVEATGLTGGGYLTKETKTAMSELFSAAKKQGLDPKINSAYRSYQTQLSTFNYWVQSELNKGRSRQEAETYANRYSARPGHSEHQLGTTADVACNGCSAFDKSSKGNGAIWQFLKDNAHKYGFVVSYPQDKENLTGYVYEPWHIRYIGKTLAAELYAKNYLSPAYKEYLEKFLREKKLY